MPEERLDAEKLDVLGKWGAGLQADAREEVAAAGRAILLLIEEIERLHVMLWDRKLYPSEVVHEPAAIEAQDGDVPEPEAEDAFAAEPPPEPEALPEALGGSLRSRLRRRRRDRFSTA